MTRPDTLFSLSSLLLTVVRPDFLLSGYKFGKRREVRDIKKKKGDSLYEAELYWLWHTRWSWGWGGMLLSHTPKFKPFPEARPNKVSGKGPCSGAVGRHSAVSLKNNRKHMWRAWYREGTAGPWNSQEPGSQGWDPTWPGWFPLTLPYPLH